MSLHEIDKYLMVFLNCYKNEFLLEYLKHKNIKSAAAFISIVGNRELLDIGINGYTATSCKSMWHGGNFHPEICLFQTGYKDVQTIDDTSSVVFIGRYIIENGIRKWVNQSGEVLPQDKQIDFVELTNKKDEIRSNCLGSLRNQIPIVPMDTNGGGNKKTKKLFKGVNDTSDSVFGAPDPVPYSHFLKPLSDKEIDRILNSMFNQIKVIEFSMYEGKSSKKAQLKKKAIKTEKDKKCKK
jgi:hypothetical protein